MGSKRLKIIIWGEANQLPIELTIAITQELADRIQQTRVKATTVMVEEFIQVPAPGLSQLDKYKIGG